MEHRGIRAPMREARVTSADGTSITYYVIGTGPRRWLMPPAMGAPLLAMKHLLERFAAEYTIVTWDQRGFYRSSPPADPQAFRVDDHLRGTRSRGQAARDWQSRSAGVGRSEGGLWL